MRCFVALEVSDSTRQLALRVHDVISAVDDGWKAEKWVVPGNLHVTLAFLGSIDDATAGDLVSRLRMNAIAPLTLSDPILVAHPNAANASMLWLRYRGGEVECAELASFVRRCAKESGIAQGESSQGFVPHVTLVRTRRGRRLPKATLTEARSELALNGNLFVSVPTVKVFSSSLGSSGPTYHEVAMAPLLGSRSG